VRDDSGSNGDGHGTPDLSALSGLDGHHALDPAERAGLDARGHAVVRGLATAAEVAVVRPAVESLAHRRAAKVGPLDERDTYGQAFLQVANLWRHDPVVRRFVFAPRFARVAAELLGVEGVRLYHDQMLVKEPGGGRTPWHQDQVYWPLDTDRTVTMWMPLVDVPAEIGTMTFASGSHRHGNLGEHLIGDESDTVYSTLVDRLGLTEETHGALAAGDATFHCGWTLHRAPANPTDQMRPVMTVIYYADGARVAPIDSEARRFDQRVWLGGTAEGERADGPLNPRLWPPA
jgi:ectoine hydroxylase-related dioxygenase (phytanoyl-CoA dioxygenase family)